MVEDRVEELKQLLPQCLLADWVRLGRRLVRILKDRHHADQRDRLLDRLLQQARASSRLREDRRLKVPAVSYPPELPITNRKDEILAAIGRHQVLVVAGETGSGKTTQLPKICLEAGLGIEGKIASTQPRRVAALSISRRVAEEMGVIWGQHVGCKIRFDDRSSPETYIKFMTDGILLAELQRDPDLSEYNAIIVDEAHERSLNIDFLLGHLKNLLTRRRDLKLIITSATIDTAAFARHFDNAPIIEVSGRVYPVQVEYQPLDPLSEERGDQSYVDAAVEAAGQILTMGRAGDVLIFMPGERDIRETSEQLAGRFSGAAEIIPLYGRLSSGEQQRVFAPSVRRKIVIATNIAETSLTLPGIRYVIDSGLARISRYNPRTRTKRLPIEPISQSSANQRKGRAGRVQEGVCLRLYSEEDFQSRSLFTQPEIQRANLAEVILRMKAFQLGDIESFPFVQPPTPAAIANGYALLQELGALDSQRNLTHLGEDLAILPIDPTLGRMLLQSQHEHATRELLIIAAGLSIQDPRERPLDQKEAAAAAHGKFNDPQSDFLALLNIWNAVHDDWDRLRTQSQRRKFCRQHFLSYLRMREWQDLHSQLHDALEDLGGLKLNESNAAYGAIHRSILAGLIGHVARFEERNNYKASGNRVVSVFPGSSLYARGEPIKKPLPKGEKARPKPKSNQPEWIVAGEIVETSQLFARTVAGIDPQWIFQLAPHCCKMAHKNPHWNPAAGNVLVDEIITLHGMEVQRRKVAYGNVNAKEATAIFIRTALVEGNLLPRRSAQNQDSDQDGSRILRPVSQEANTWPAQYQFLAHNQKVREKIEMWRTRVRDYSLKDLDTVLRDFYAKQIENVSSLHELNRFLQQPGSQNRLCITESELADGQSLEFDATAFPNEVALAGQSLAVSYAYAPGEEHDGVTIELPSTIAKTTPPALLEWAVPGLRQDLITELLRTLPKAIRKELMPFAPKVAEIVSSFHPSGSSFLHDLASHIHRKYGIKIPDSAWARDSFPPHLRPRIQILDEQRKVISSGRDFAQAQKELKESQIPLAPGSQSPEWIRALQKWEQFHLSAWPGGEIPERVLINQNPAQPIYAYPGLELAEHGVNVRLFHTLELATSSSLPGMQRLVEIAIQKDLAWLEKDLKGLGRYGLLFGIDTARLQIASLNHLKAYLLPMESAPRLTQAHFDAAVAMAKQRMPGLAQQFIDRLGEILKLRDALRAGTATSPVNRTLSSFQQLGSKPIPSSSGTNSLADQLGDLPSFLDRTPYARLTHVPRYLKAMQIRIERARLNPIKDQERQRLLAPYIQALTELSARKALASKARQLLDLYRWMVEEYKVSLFAQELGTAVPVSPKRLDQHLEETRRAVRES